MKPVRNHRLRPIPSSLKMQPRFWSSFTFMCKWVFFEARKQEKRERQPVVFVGPHPRVREHARQMFDKKLNHHG